MKTTGAVTLASSLLTGYLLFLPVMAAQMSESPAFLPRSVPTELPGGMERLSGPIEPFLAPSRIADVLQNISPDAQLAMRSGTGATIYQAVSPSVVLVVTEHSLGSGSLLSEDGYIITNWHVIQDATRVGVVFKPEQEGGTIREVDVRRALVEKTDEVADLALLRVDSVPTGRVPVSLGRMEDVSIGGDVHAIGHPSGENWTYTRGFVSQIRRGYEWSTESGVDHSADVIQTQTPINPGNSGGPLLDQKGNLVGINSFKAEGEALNFSVSVDEVRSFLERPEGRQAARREAQPNDQGQCDDVVPIASERQVMDGFGAGEMVLLDVDCDGESDIEMFVPDDEAEPILMSVDTTGDGRIDTVFFDTNRDGEVDVSIYDTTGDGEPDLEGLHRDGDPEPYLVQKLD